MTRKILIDTDPGVDDSMAILSALRSPELEVVGMTSVFGNTDVDHCTANALRLAETEGREDIPVARGAARPMVKPLSGYGRHVHGADGMGNTNPPPPKGQPDPRPAVQFIVDMVRAHPGEITLMPLGPLTNIALAIRTAPEVIPLVSEVVLMGGSAFVPGNVSPLAEANIHGDPHAAEVVFAAGWPVTMIGLDVTTKVMIQPPDLKRLYAARNPATELLRRIQPFYQDYFNRNLGYADSFHIHDPSVTAYLLQPDLFEVIEAPVYVVAEGRCAGKTIADPRRMWGEERRASRVAVDVPDPQAVLDLLVDRLIA